MQYSLGAKAHLLADFFLPNLKVGVMMFFRTPVCGIEYRNGHTKNNAHFEPVFCIFIPNGILLKFVATTTLLLFFVCSAFSQSDLLDRMKRELPSITDSVKYTDALNRIGMLFYEQNADSTLYYAGKAREIAIRHRYARGVADATNIFGIYFDIIGNTQLALRYYNEAHSQYAALGDSSNMVQTLMNIASVYYVRDLHDKAIANYEAALRMGSRLSNDSILSLAIYNYVLQYPERFSRDSADFYIAKANAIANRYNDIRMQLALTQLNAYKYFANGERHKGIRLLEEALRKGLDRGLHFMSLDIMARLGDIHADVETGKAVGYYQQARQIALQKNYIGYNIAATRNLLDYYSSIGKADSALFYSRILWQHVKVRDSINRRSGIDYIDYALKEKELDIVKNDARNNRLLLILSAVIILLALVMIIVLWRNAQRRKEVQLMLAEQVASLESAAIALETGNTNYARLIKVIAHDLRNPIGAISTVNEMMLDSPSLSGKDREWALLIKDAGDRCLQLITELLKTEFETRIDKLEKQPVDIVPFIERTILMTSYRANEKKQKIILLPSPSLTVPADPDKLSRVLENLLVNAIKFSPEETSIELAVTDAKDHVTLSVRDSGIGIPATMLPSLFDPFTRAKRKGTAGEASFGLGLYIAREIMEAHKGRIRLESEEGKGTVFYIDLPKWEDAEI
jgi:signal transduction histidine kinase